MNETTSLSTEERKQEGREYSAYKGVGGFLSPADYEKTKRIFLQIEKVSPSVLKTELDKSNAATKAQFINLCKSIGLEVSPAQLLLYCYLQRYEKVRNALGEMVLVGKAVKESIQVIFANCLLLSGADDLCVKYMVSLPHIFKFITSFGSSRFAIEQGLSQAITSYSLLREKK